MSDYGVTSSGFVTKPLSVIKEEIEAGWKAIFGDDIDVSATSVFGQLSGNLSKKFSEQWEALESVYSTFSPDSASDIPLDNVAAMVDVFRLSATSSAAECICYGDQGTVITLGALISQSTTGEEFAADVATTIDAAVALYVDISIAVLQDSTLYRITINGNNYDYTSDASATAEEIMAGLKVEVDAGSEPVTFTDNLDGTATIVSDDDTTTSSYVLTANLQFDLIGTPVDFTASNAGEIATPAESIDTIVTPISGWNSVLNIVLGTDGRNTETDEEFRVRRRTSQQQGSATDEAIRSALLTEVENVTSATIISNRTDGVVSGRPAHSFESIVEGGTDADIADKIWEKQPSGIQPHGDETVVVKDSQNNDQTIKFSRPTNVYIWVNVDITLNSEEDFPANGSELIEDAIVEYGIENFLIGDDVIYQELNVPIFEVPGIGGTDIELAVSATAGGPAGAYSAANVTIDENELSKWDADRIVITVL